MDQEQEDGVSWDAVREMLVRVVAARGGYGGVRTWSGPTPYASDGTEPYAIAGAIGYEVAPASHALVALTREQATATLEFFAADSMVMSTGKPAEPEVLAAVEMGLGQLGPTARFYSNGDWHDARSGSFGWRALSNSTFDGGVIGFSDEFAFAAWFEEED